MRIISSKSDLRQWVSECNPNLELEWYTFDNRDALDDAITDDLLDLLRDKYDFLWEQELPEISSQEFLELYETYERGIEKMEVGEEGNVLSTDENGKPKWINREE